MAVKIRLQRRGRKGYPFYHIVAADSRAPRDGKFIEKIGTYNPNVDPIAVEINMDRAVYWLNVGAQPTDTAKNLLSSKGVLLKKHLLGGVAKGAFSEEVADQKFTKWMSEKDDSTRKILAKKESEEQAKLKALHEGEVAANKAKAEAIAKKNAVEEVVEEVVVEEPTETAAAEATEEKAAE